MEEVSISSEETRVLVETGGNGDACNARMHQQLGFDPDLGNVGRWQRPRRAQHRAAERDRPGRVGVPAASRQRAGCLFANQIGLRSDEQDIGS